jgi:hypothetical protein
VVAFFGRTRDVDTVSESDARRYAMARRQGEVARTGVEKGRPVGNYLWSFRNEGAFCEALAARVADDIVDAIAPRALVVRVTQNVRGGIALMAVAQRPAAGSP